MCGEQGKLEQEAQVCGEQGKLEQEAQVCGEQLGKAGAGSSGVGSI